MARESIFLIIALFLLIDLVIIVAVIAFFKGRKNQAITSTNNQGLKIPVKATFGGSKTLKKLNKNLSFSHNSAFPLFHLFEDHIICRVLFKKIKRLDEIELIDSTNSFKSIIITLYFRNDDWTFSANLFRVEDQVQVLKFFQNKNVPLSEEAKQIVMNSIL